MSENTGSSRKVITNSIIYTACGLLQKCFSFFLLPLYTAYLSPNDYGVTNIANSFLSTMSFVAAFSLYSAVSRFYVELKHDKEKLRRFYGSVLIFVFVSCLIIGVLLTIFRDLLTTYVFVGIDYYPVVLVCLVQLVFSCQHTLHTYILRSQQKAMKCSLLTLAYFFVNLGLSISFVVVWKMGALGVLLAGALSAVIYTVYFIIDMCWHKEIRFCMDFSLLKDALKYSIPIMPHNLSTHIAHLVSNILIGGTSSLSNLGIYSVAAQFANIADTVQNYVDSAYGPWLYEKLHDQEQGYKNSIRQVAGLLIAVIGLFMLGIALFAQDYILLLVQKSYAFAWRYVPWIVLVYAIKTMYYFYVEVLFYYKKASRMLFIATFTGSVVNVFLSAFMIPQWGVYGSIVADGVAMVIRVGIIVFISKRFDDVGLRLRDFLLDIFIVGMFVFLGLAPSYVKYQETFNFVNLLYKIVVVVVYICVQGFIHRKTAGTLGKMLLNKLRRR